MKNFFKKIIFITGVAVGGFGLGSGSTPKEVHVAIDFSSEKKVQAEEKSKLEKYIPKNYSQMNLAK